MRQDPMSGLRRSGRRAAGAGPEVPQAVHHARVQPGRPALPRLHQRPGVRRTRDGRGRSGRAGRATQQVVHGPQRT